MKKILPFFKLNGKTYELKPTRYLMLEYEKIGEANLLTDEEKFTSVKIQEMTAQVQDLGKQLDTLKKAYYADMTNKEAKAQYKACKEEYDEQYDELIKYQIESKSSRKLQKVMIDSLENIAILGLAEQYFNGDYDKGNELWCQFVDSTNMEYASQWLMAMADSLFADDEEEDDNSFLSKKRARRQEMEENRKKGLRHLS